MGCGKHAWLLYRKILDPCVLVNSAACTVSYKTMNAIHCAGTHVQRQAPRAFIQVESIIEVGVCRETTRVDCNCVGWGGSPICKEGHVLLRRTCPETRYLLILASKLVSV